MASRISEFEQSRDEFLSRMSHELRTPLNAVIGFSRVLESNRAGNQRPEDIELLRRVRASGEQLLRIVQDVLDQSSLRSGALAVQLSPTDVGEIVTRVAERHRAPVEAKGITLRALVPAGVQPVPLDASRFEQVVEHLVDNAVKFTASGTIRVSLTVHRASRRPTRLTIADTGIGIPADRLKRIFHAFEQVDGSARRQYGGVGLGLPLARQLCQAMGCRLRAASTLGEGSTFTIQFPPGLD